jgi:uncharacterized protein
MASWFVLFLVVPAALLGQFGIIVASYNRLNSLGWKRTRIKAIEKSIFLLGGLLPVLIFGCEFFLGQREWPLNVSTWLWPTKAYVIAMISFLLATLPGWIAIRPAFVNAKEKSTTTQSHLWSSSDLTDSPFRGRLFPLFGALPGNQVGWTEANKKSLKIESLPRQLSGLTIGHISDIHLTGRLSRDFYRRALDWVQSQTPDLVVLSGDIVDYNHCLDDVLPVFQDMSAELGLYFLLGNHDRRLTDPMKVCGLLESVGWIDLGRGPATFVRNGSCVELLGNERPWFDRGGSRSKSEADWRIAVSHSPDQFEWGQQTGSGLVLAGHTHGGQIRFPLIGPLVSPSWFGSRYASGVFEANQTIMHVSRGLAGVHPLRWGCPPEVSILVCK